MKVHDSNVKSNPNAPAISQHKAQKKLNDELAKQKDLEIMATFQNTNVSIYHIWLGKITGYVFSSNKSEPIKNGEKLKYMGFTSDIGWPKKMNTGRLIHKPNGKSKKKQKKLSRSQKTEIVDNSNTKANDSAINGVVTVHPLSVSTKSAKLPTVSPNKEWESLPSNWRY
jgi:hypothetical protein